MKLSGAASPAEGGGGSGRRQWGARGGDGERKGIGMGWGEGCTWLALRGRYHWAEMAGEGRRVEGPQREAGGTEGKPPSAPQGTISKSSSFPPAPQGAPRTSQLLPHEIPINLDIQQLYLGSWGAHGMEESGGHKEGVRTALSPHGGEAGLVREASGPGQSVCLRQNQAPGCQLLGSVRPPAQPTGVTSTRSLRPPPMSSLLTSNRQGAWL